MVAPGKRKTGEEEQGEELMGSIEKTDNNFETEDEADDKMEEKSESDESSEYSGLESEDDLELDNENGKAVLHDQKQLQSTVGMNGQVEGKELKGFSEESNKVKTDEYDEYDSSDEEEIRNTIGNVPMEWYKEYDHIGYDLGGKKIKKVEQMDELDEFLDKMDNPDYWRTVRDKLTGQNVRMSDKDIELIKNIQKGKYPGTGSGNYNAYEPWIDFFTHEKSDMPVTSHPPHKRSFLPSRHEAEKISYYVHAIKMGWIKRPSEKQKKENEEEDEDKFYDIWGKNNEAENKRMRYHIPAPKLKLPGHEESYNPPPEYLMTEEEEMAWKNKDPEDRKSNFIPQKHDCLRKVSPYDKFINERFERCLDLYLCPRMRKERVRVDAEDLLPKLPKPRDLQPFPTTLSIVFRGHSDIVRSLSIDPTGQWFVSGSDDGYVKVWELATGRCMKTFDMEAKVSSVSWNPNASLSLIAATSGKKLIIINPGVGDKLALHSSDNMIANIQMDKEEEQPDSEEQKPAADWSKISSTMNEDKELFKQGFRMKIITQHEISAITWHAKGDYLSTLQPKGASRAVLLHQVSRARTQCPFRRSKGLVQAVQFHPTKPFFFVATQRTVRVYNLVKQMLTKKLMTASKWVSSIAIHPSGDNVITGSYDAKLTWFDLDLSAKPYRTLRHHKKAIRQVRFHSRYPLFASCSDDGSTIVCHGMVYNDLMQNPLIVPVKILRGHGPGVSGRQSLGTLDCQFHPTQPWILSAGSDATVRLFSY